MTELILKTIKENPMSSLGTLSQATGLSRTAVNYHLNKLQRDQRIKRVIPVARWEILDDAPKE